MSLLKNRWVKILVIVVLAVLFFKLVYNSSVIMATSQAQVPSMPVP